MKKIHALFLIALLFVVAPLSVAANHPDYDVGITSVVKKEVTKIEKNNAVDYRAMFSTPSEASTNIDTGNPVVALKFICEPIPAIHPLLLSKADNWRQRSHGNYSLTTREINDNNIYLINCCIKQCRSGAASAAEYCGIAS